MLIEEVILIAKDMGVWLVCNPLQVPRCEYPDQCDQEQSHLGRFAKFRLTGEETGDEGSASDSSHAGEFWFRVGYKRDGRHVHYGGASYLP